MTILYLPFPSPIVLPVLLSLSLHSYSQPPLPLVFPFSVHPRKPAHRAKLYEYSSSIFWLIQSTTELFLKSAHHLPLPENKPQTHLNITNPLATKFATPIYIVGQGALGTTYFNTNTVTPPAIPPAKLANPKNSTTRAFQATPLPEYENESAESRVFSMLFIMSMPRDEKMSGSQSMKVMWMVEPFLALWDQTAASRRTKNARENCEFTVSAMSQPTL